MEKENKYTIKSCGIYDCDADWSWRNKGNKDYNLWAVFRGEGTLSLCGIPHSAIIGSCFLIPPQTLTHGTHNPNNRLFVYSIHFSANDSPLSFCNKRILNISFFKELFDHAILFYNMNKTGISQAYLEVLLNEFFLSPDAPKGKQNFIDSVQQRCIAEICDKINSTPEAKHHLSGLAAEYGYSATYLGKLFHKIVGVSFSDYLLNARINYAKIVLLNSESSISEIAEKLGYYDSAHFIKQFKKLVGCTPNTYR